MCDKIKIEYNIAVMLSNSMIFVKYFFNFKIAPPSENVF